MQSRILYMRRVLLKALAALVVLAVVLLAAVYLYLRRSLPVVNGTIVVAGLSGPVEIVRDADAIPHIFAATKRDGLYGLGYVHAQDRLWQMEFQRRVGFGRLSEIFGEADRAPGSVSADGWLSAAPRARRGRALPPGTRAEIDAYVAGVNAFIASHRGSRCRRSSPCSASNRSRWTAPTWWSGRR